MARIDSDLARAYLWWRQTNPWHRAANCFVKAHLDVAKGKRRYPHGPDHKFGGNWGTDERRNAGIYYCDNFPAGWREPGTAADVCRSERSRRVDHEGWYTDSFQDGTMQGYVLQLPARRGVPQYVPATAHSDWDGVTLYLHDICDDKLDAAQIADRHAEIKAEESRDYDEAFQAGTAVRENLQEISRLRAECLNKFARYRAAMKETVSPVVIDMLRENMRDSAEEYRDEIRELRAKNDEYRDSIPSRLMDAFDEGIAS